jgi:hypothetical protein
MSNRRITKKTMNNQKNDTIKSSLDLNTNQNSPKPLNSEELQDFMYWTNQIMNTWNNTSAGYPSTFTPILTNERLGEIGFTPTELDATELEEALKSPATSTDSLLGYSEWLQFTETISKRTLGYLGNLPSFDMNYVCINPPEDRKDKEYLDDLKKFKDFCINFDYKSEFSKIHRRTMVLDAYYGIFRTDCGNKYTFQELPANNCKITGKSPEYGFIFDFDMSWFLRQGLSIDQYPNAMKKLWYRVYGEGSNIQNYNPANKLDKRKGVFATWTQTSPLLEDGGFTCFKFNSDIYTAVPFLTSLFNDAVNKNLIRSLQNNQYIIASQKILVGLIPLLKEQKSGQVKDAIAISPEIMAKYLGFLKQGLNEAIKISGVPFGDVKDINYELPNKNMYTDYSTNLAGNSGVTSRTIFAPDRMSATEVEYSSNVDEMIATQVYPQYGTIFTTFVNSLTKKYKFLVTFSGSNFWKSRERRFDYAEKLANKGMFIPQLYASALGQNPFVFEEMLRDSKKSDIQNLLQLPLNSNTKDYGTNFGGRPKTEIPSDSTDRNLDREDGE